MDELVRRHNGPLQAESRLGLTGEHKLQTLRKQINDYHDHITQSFMETVIAAYPNFDCDVNEIAGLTKLSRKHRAIAKASTMSSQG
jgi:hypothetical protein